MEANVKAKIDGIEVEGTPDELARFARMMQFEFAGTAILSHANVGSEATKFVDEEFAFRVLKRRSLSNEQKAFLSLLHTKSPSWVSALDLQEATKYRPNQLSGLLGAFGKRVASTEGYREGASFFEVEWDYDEDCYKYRLPEGSLAAVKRAGI